MFNSIFRIKFVLPFLALLFIFSPYLVNAQTGDESVNLYMFSSPTCPHCSDAKSYIAELEKNNELNFNFIDYTLSDNLDLARDFYSDYKVPKNYQGLVPVMFVGDRYFLGFNEDVASDLANSLTMGNVNDLDNNDVATTEKNTINLPWIGELNLLNFSLPILAIILGTIDGFNVCSLGALVLILGLVIALKSRKRIFMLGSAFLLTNGIIYGLMIFIWHQLFSLLAPYLRSLELVVGILSIAGGIYLLREFYKAYKSGPICSSNNILSRLAPKVERIFQNKTNWLLLIGVIMLFSAAITIIEFPCSAVLPVIFSGILVEAGLSQGMALAYISLFILFYLLDEIIVFIIAVLTMKIKIVSPKFIVFFNLLAAIIFLALGMSYLLRLSL